MNTSAPQLDDVRRSMRAQVALGTLCTIEATGRGSILDRAIAEAFASIQETEALMHPSREGSDLHRINQSVGRSIQIDAKTWEVLRLSQQIHKLSEGGFDPCLPEREGSICDLELHGTNFVTVGKSVAVDLGGIAKGYAVDRAVTILERAGCTGGIVNAGGDLRVFGDGHHTIVVRAANHASLQITLSECSLAVSDIGCEHPPEFRGYYSRCGDSLKRTQTLVSAASAAVADALTKCAMVCEETRLRKVISAFNAEIISLQEQ